jgi:hypothetical protein
MDKKFKVKKTNRNTISYGKIRQPTRKLEIDSKTIKEKRNLNK